MFNTARKQIDQLLTGSTPVLSYPCVATTVKAKTQQPVRTCTLNVFQAFTEPIKSLPAAWPSVFSQLLCVNTKVLHSANQRWMQVVAEWPVSRIQFETSTAILHPLESESPSAVYLSVEHCRCHLCVQCKKLLSRFNIPTRFISPYSVIVLSSVCFTYHH